jgi:uncharacterized protein YebE (UPF0316 family)
MIETAVLIMCVKIFCFRIIDVTLSTVRMVLTVKERSGASAMVGFVEVFIWYSIVREALSSAGPYLPTAIAYAGGFATGTYVGGRVARKFIKGHVVVSVVTTGQNDDLVAAIRDAGYAITVMDVNSSEFSEEKYMLLADVDKAHLRDFQKLVEKLDPGAFILIQETKNVINGYNRN